ncbi:hypothetical protein CALVIDRAFT_527533 [Calocera viscosa TUFC12733]|uniref:Uncharacterized protein n=1 Tax=Calocera viscosa (strain TUFC12733) TaxID=1330018 RepID=A0A167M9I6_CALVF|nr:hypothetical protein CALVIDRAFT_527533 [Calocera viscosa TUFC12733]
MSSIQKHSLLEPSNGTVQDMLDDWDSAPPESVHYILFSVIVTEMNRQEMTDGPLDADRVAHDLVYHFMNDWRRYRRRGGRLPHQQADFPVLPCENAADYMRSLQAGLEAMSLSAPRSGQRTSSSTPSSFSPGLQHASFPITQQPQVADLPAIIPRNEATEDDLADMNILWPAAELIAEIAGLLEGFHVPDILGYSEDARIRTRLRTQSLRGTENDARSSPPPPSSVQSIDAPTLQRTPLEIRSDRSTDFPQSPSIVSWHPSQESELSTLENIIEQYSGMQVAVEYPLPFVSAQLAFAFQLYFWEEGTNVAVWSTLDSMLPNPSSTLETAQSQLMQSADAARTPGARASSIIKA